MARWDKRVVVSVSGEILRLPRAFHRLPLVEPFVCSLRGHETYQCLILLLELHRKMSLVQSLQRLLILLLESALLLHVAGLVQRA